MQSVVPNFGSAGEREASGADAQTSHAGATGSIPLRWQPPGGLASHVLAPHSSQIGTCRQRRRVAMPCRTGKVRRVGRIAGAVVARDVRVGTERPAHLDAVTRLVVAEPGGADRIGRRT